MKIMADIILSDAKEDRICSTMQAIERLCLDPNNQTNNIAGNYYLAALGLVRKLLEEDKINKRVKISWAISRENKKELTDEDKDNIVFLINDCAKNPKNSKGFVRTMCSRDFPIKATSDFVNSLENCVCQIIDIDYQADTYKLLVAKNLTDLYYYFD